MQTVLNRVNSANINTPGGKIRGTDNTITIRTMGKMNTLDDFRQIAVASRNGKPILLTDVADVVDDWEDAENFSRTNGVPSVTLAIRKQSRTNTVQVVDAVNQRLQTILKQDLPPDIRMDIVMDQSRYIRENVADVWNTILFGGFWLCSSRICSWATSAPPSSADSPFLRRSWRPST